MANRIRELRQQQGLTMKELARRIHAHFTTIGKLERGEMQLSHEWMFRLADALGVSVAEVIGLDAGPKSGTIPVLFLEPNQTIAEATTIEHLSWPRSEWHQVLIPSLDIDYWSSRADAKMHHFAVQTDVGEPEEGKTYLIHVDGARYCVGTFLARPNRYEPLREVEGQPTLFEEFDDLRIEALVVMGVHHYAPAREHELADPAKK